jgi:hypothetical protein
MPASIKYNIEFHKNITSPFLSNFFSSSIIGFRKTCMMDVFQTITLQSGNFRISFYLNLLLLHIDLHMCYLIAGGNSIIWRYIGHNLWLMNWKWQCHQYCVSVTFWLSGHWSFFSNSLYILPS